MVPISDFQTYTTGMEKSIVDKLWWLDHISPDVQTVYDYGCADGALLSTVNLMRPELQLKGYDYNPEMLDAAQRRLPQVSFTYFPLDTLPTNSVVIVSSVLHEVFSYQGNPMDTLDNIFKLGAKYIAVRDMAYKYSYYNHNLHMENLMKVMAYGDKKQIADFEKRIGPLFAQKNLTHFLLKYRYTANWDREVREDYFALDVDKLVDIAQNIYGYMAVYRNHYTLPFIQGKVKEDFNIDLQDNTHVKILFEKED